MSTINTSKYHHAPKKAITFIRAGEKSQAQEAVNRPPPHSCDWQLQADQEKQLKFPQHIITTSLQPDMIITSEASKQLIMLELTVSWEEHIEEANERKCAKY